VIEPLTTKQVHQLRDYIQKYDSLSSLRTKILSHLQNNNSTDGGDSSATKLRVETSISKSELEDIYAPFKPPFKGSLEDRIRTEYPELVNLIDELWKNKGRMDDSSGNKIMKKGTIYPKDKAVTLLANRIAGDVGVIDAVMERCHDLCKIQVKGVNATKTKNDTGKNGRKTAGKENGGSKTYEIYNDYNNKLNYLKDHQILAIRRGCDQKMLKITFELDNNRFERIINSVLSKQQHVMHPLYHDAISDAWSRLLRKRCTSRLWKESCKRAEERAVDVFCNNLRKALLAPPADMTNRKAMLVMDPGFQSGIKCAILSDEGLVISLDTVKFMNSAKDNGKQHVISLLTKVKCFSGNNDDRGVCVVLGNGHGTREARELLLGAGSEADINVEVNLVSEAGASVWSVTEMASQEFPDQSPTAVAAVSIGRRFLNPLNELVKIPSKSLGLGMYQHDLSEKVLDEKLRLTSIDAVAEVGVDVNSCSLHILQKVPSLTPALCGKIMKSRPILCRRELMSISGFGPKTFENCAAFIRISGGKEPLDETLVHPESYSLARWLLKELNWKLGDPTSVGVDKDTKVQPEHRQRITKKAAALFGISDERVQTVIGHLFFSITSPDPRLRQNASYTKEKSIIGSTDGCSTLSERGIDSLNELRERLPVRNIASHVRNVVDFGVFADLNIEEDGLLHRSKMGSVPLDSIMVGQELGVDILGVSDSGKISLALSGLNLHLDDGDSSKCTISKANPSSRKRRRK